MSSNRLTGEHACGSFRSRYVWIDLLRIGACLLVIFNHLPGYTLYQTNTGVMAWAYMSITMFTRINVPLFLMISGALLLKHDEAIGRTLRHRVSKMVGAIVIFGFLCYLVKHRGGGVVLRAPLISFLR